MEHIKRNDEQITVNNKTDGAMKFKVTIKWGFFNELYDFIVYANDEDEAIDITLDYVDKHYNSLTVIVPEDFDNDYGYDNDEYITYGDECPYVFNSDGDIAVLSDGFNVEEIL